MERRSATTFLVFRAPSLSHPQDPTKSRDETVSLSREKWGYRATEWVQDSLDP